jgi:hypothetical protein
MTRIHYIFLLFLCSPTLIFAFDTSNWTSLFWQRATSSRNVPPLGYYNPANKGGSMMDVCFFLIPSKNYDKQLGSKFLEPPLQDKGNLSMSLFLVHPTLLYW